MAFTARLIRTKRRAETDNPSRLKVIIDARKQRPTSLDRLKCQRSPQLGAGESSSITALLRDIAFAGQLAQMQTEKESRSGIFACLGMRFPQAKRLISEGRPHIEYRFGTWRWQPYYATSTEGARASKAPR